jgi:hypothetical protein
MSSVSTNESSTAGARELEITSWPLRQEPIRSAAVLLLIAAVTTYALLATASWMVGIVTLLALLSSVWRLWIPVHFELGRRGVVQRVGSRRRRTHWREISGYQLRGRGAFLLMDDRPGPLSLLGAIFLRYPAQPDQLRELLEFYLTPQRGEIATEDMTVRTSAAMPGSQANSDEAARDQVASPGRVE